MTELVDNDTREKGTSGPFETWEGDHTALVHVLWAAKHAGLMLEKDFDAISSMILRSRFMAARLAAHDAQVLRDAAAKLHTGEEPEDVEMMPDNEFWDLRYSQFLRVEADRIAGGTSDER